VEHRQAKMSPPFGASGTIGEGECDVRHDARRRSSWFVGYRVVAAI
jgi:hypothetical protein